MAKTADKFRKFDVKLPKYVDRSRMDEIADEIVEYVRDRTESGKNNRGQKFPKYSKAYTDSLEFKIAGKSKTKVNLTLTGDMLISMDWLKKESTKDKITIGFQKSDDENIGKSEGNTRGTYGTATGSPAKARPFLGFIGAERQNLIKILKKYRKTSPSNVARALAAAATQELRGDG